MSGLFTFYIKLVPAEHSNYLGPVGWSSCRVTLPSRYEADELFRELQEMQHPGTIMRMFPRLGRSSAQFWTDHTAFGQNILKYLSDNDGCMPGTKRHALITHPVTEQNLIPDNNIVMGPDWTSGGTFFIRNRRRPDIFWTVTEDLSGICASVVKRTKFKITVANSNPTPFQLDLQNQGQLVFVRDDWVTVCAVAEKTDTTTAQATTPGDDGPGDDTNNVKYLDLPVANGSENKPIRLVDTEHVMKFGDLICDAVGFAYSPTGTVSTPVLARMAQGGAEEWELC